MALRPDTAERDAAQSKTLPWFRFYHETLDDPKVQRLDPVTFKHWVNILCVAGRHGGKFPANADLAFALRIDEIALESLLDRLLIAGLIEVRKGGANGSYIAPHGWDKRQYKSDTSSERVKRFRKRSGNDDVTPPDTEADTEETPIVPTGDDLSFDELVTQWNLLAEAKGLPVVEKLTEQRKRAFRTRWKANPDKGDWKRALQHIHDTPFLCGENDRDWTADFDFLLQAKSFPRLVEGSYGR